MYSEFEMVGKSKEVIESLANGLNPFSGEPVQGDGLFNDARIVRCLNVVTGVLDDVLKGNYKKPGKALAFVITPEQKKAVAFPERKIGVNDFSKCINACLNIGASRRMTGVELNKKLKKLGILGETVTAEGKKRTVINEKSAEFGFETERKIYKEEEYDKVVINNAGKKYLLDNLESIMSVEL